MIFCSYILKEFKFLKSYTNFIHVGSVANEEPSNFFQKFEESGSPFDISKECSEEDIFASASKVEDYLLLTYWHVDRTITF